MGLKSTTKAYVHVQRKKNANIIVFKIRDKQNTPGYVCLNTTYLKSDDIIKRLDEIKPNVIKENAKPVKKNLCFLLEMMMRTYQAPLFQRPYFIKFD